MSKLILVLLVVLFTGNADANRGDFCAGFEEGYKTIKGDMAMVPMCPMKPLTPLGSTDYREGLKAGMKKAKNSRW